jgi:hypothetical protein
MLLKKLFLPLFTLCAISVSAETNIPEHFNSAPSLSVEAIELATNCAEGTTESSYIKMVKDSGSNNLVAINSPDPLKPYLLVNAKTTYCIPLSEKKFPILAQEAFDDTITFSNMDNDQAKLLKISLARQIALTGTAVALLTNNKGNAYKLSYMVTTERPTKIYYQLSFLKPGEFDVSKYETVMNYSGNVSVVNRGQPSERVKFLFTK